MSGSACRVRALAHMLTQRGVRVGEAVTLDVDVPHDPASFRRIAVRITRRLLAAAEKRMRMEYRSG